MSRKVVVIPGKAESDRIPGKNWRPFFQGSSLIELKVLTSLESCADLVLISTDQPELAAGLQSDRLIVKTRSPHLCRNHVNLKELFSEVLEGFEDDLVFWAHATSPFVRAATINHAFDCSLAEPEMCILGVEIRHEFLWSESGPLNYDPLNQPRSQDLEPIYAVTGGVHCARGSQFIHYGAVSFQPARFVPLTFPESLDIDNFQDWQVAQVYARSLWEGGE